MSRVSVGSYRAGVLQLTPAMHDVAADRTSIERAYFDELSALPRFEPAVELSLARAVVSTRRAYWAALLDRDHLDAVLDRIAAHAKDEGVAGIASALAVDDARSEAAIAALSDALDRVGDEHAAADKIVELAARRSPQWHARVRRARTAYLAARDRFVRANLRLVVLFARRVGYDHIALADRIQEGNLGLLKAVDRFDPERGVRFSTYAAWWIRHQIVRALANTAHAVRVPVQLQMLYARAQRMRWHLLAEHGREPDVRELAHALDCDPERIAIALRTVGRAGMSLDAAIDDEPGMTAHALLADPRSLSELEGVVDRRDHDRAMVLLEQLSERERSVVQERFALPGAPAETFDEIGRRHGISRERARQIQRIALVRLRQRLEPRRKMPPYAPTRRTKPLADRQE